MTSLIECDCVPEKFKHLLLNNKYLYCCTLDRLMRPHIVPLLFVFSKNEEGCVIRCVTEKNTKKVANIRKNPNVTFTTDIAHPEIPLLNSGIMIETVAKLVDDEEQVEEALRMISEKHVNHAENIPMCHETDILIKATLNRIIYWKGPFFERYNCLKRKKIE